jgi:hypothetical protein
MDANTTLLLALTGESTRWEDEERGNYDVDQLRQEFRSRLYATEIPPVAPAPTAEKMPTDAK